MVILHLINSMSDSSISRIVSRIVEYSGQQGYTFHVGSLNKIGEMHGEFSRMGARVADFSAGRGGSLACIKKIRNYIRAHRVKLVHTHTPRTLLLAAMALGAGRRPIHVATKHILNSPGDRRFGFLYALLDRALLYFPDHLVPVSEKVYREIMACPFMNPDQVTMIRNAIEQQPFHVAGQRASCRSEFGLDPDSIVIGSSGRLEKVKRYDLMLQGFTTIFERFPNSRLMLIGDGSLKTDLEFLAKELGIADAVIWTGFRKDVPRLLTALDIYVQSSVNEGLSLSILEAMAAGKPVIITDVGGARELVDNGRTGILIAPGSATEISGAIIELLEVPAKRSLLADAGRDYVEKEFGIRQMMESYRQLYESFLQPHLSPDASD
ncbi:MAG: glycosyltransferase [Geobacteraceae bacterium]